MKVLMIGCGKMGSALLQRWQNTVDAQFTVVDPKAYDLPSWVDHVRTADALKGETFDALIIAIKPQLICEVAAAYTSLRARDGVVISIAAGASLKSLSQAFETDKVIRLMPNLPVVVGSGVTGLFASDGATAEHRFFAEGLAATTGYALWLQSEDQLDRITAVAGSGPGYVFEIARVYIEAAEQLGFEPQEARTIVLHTILGSIDMALASNASLSDLRDSVMSKRGTTEAGIDALTRDGLLGQLVQDATRAAYDRAIELR
jgi:pyrroline-5-carboxylate reductase